MPSCPISWSPFCWFLLWRHFGSLVSSQTFCHPKFWNSSAPADEEAAAGRHKRKADDDERRENRGGGGLPNRCHRALVADHRFFKEIGNSNEKLTTAYLMNIIGSINVIFTQTPWILQAELDTELVSVNYGFAIDKIIIHAEPTNQSKHYNSENAFKNADDVLVLFGNEDWTPYCLAHLFTFQNFDGNVLGLAYVSSPHSYGVGGICSPRTNNPETRRPFSVNTGLSSYRSVSERQNRLLQREAELVTAHGKVKWTSLFTMAALYRLVICFCQNSATTGARNTIRPSRSARHLRAQVAATTSCTPTPIKATSGITM